MRALRDVGRYLLHEFLHISLRRDMASVLTSGCRLLASLLVTMMMYAQLYGQLSEPGDMFPLRLLVAVVVSVTVGALSKELAFLSAAAIVNGWGRDFTRHGLQLNGQSFVETRYSDGRWERRESGPRGSMHEWSDANGVYDFSVVSPVPSSRGSNLQR